MTHVVLRYLGNVWYEGHEPVNLDAEGKGGGACQRAKQWVNEATSGGPEHMEKVKVGKKAQPVSPRDSRCTLRCHC